jgi:putative NADH-flavin reductase
MRIFLLGATGRTGKYVLNFSLLMGHQVTALVRNPAKIDRVSPNLRVLPGSPESAEDIREGMRNCDAVIVTLNNLSRTGCSGDQKPFLIANSVRNCLSVMSERGAGRIAVMSMVGVGDSLEYAPAAIRGMKDSAEFKYLFADHEATDMLLHESPVNWTEARAVALCDNVPLKDLIVTYAGTPRPAPTISRRHVAKFLVECLDDNNYFKRSPIISER